MKLNKLFLLGCLPFLFASCSEDSLDDPQEKEKIYISLSIEQRTIKKKSFEFANQLMSLVSKEDENTLISPLNLQVSLGALSNGASEQTYNETATALGLQEHSLEALNHYNKTIINGILLYGQDPNVELFVKNSMIIDKKLKYKETFKENIQDYYYFSLPLGSYNFMYNSDLLEKSLNQSIEWETQGMITDLQVPIDASTKSFLYNAWCFKGKWASSFDDKNTVKASFTTENGISQTVPMMHGTQKGISYTENDDYQFASLDFGNGSFNLAVVLPKERKSVADIIPTVDWDASNATAHDVELALPKFKLGTVVYLNEILQNMGIKEAFKENAFPGIADGFHLTHMQQNLFFEIDESGVKEPSTGSANVTMTLNRPFLFAIRENSTNTLMFMGKIAKVE